MTKSCETLEETAGCFAAYRKNELQLRNFDGELAIFGFFISGYIVRPESKDFFADTLDRSQNGNWYFQSLRRRIS